VVGSVTLHFSGAHIFNATITKLLSLGLGQAHEVILKGCSAGGLAVYLHCDLFSAMLAEAGFPSIRVVCMPDAGFFRMDYPTVQGEPLYTSEQRWVYDTQGVVQMDAGCISAHPSDTWRCFFSEANLPYITTPLFVTQDLVDSWQMSNVLQLPCNPRATTGSSVCNSTWVSAMNTFRDSMVAAYAPLLQSPVNGGYLSTCYQHCHQNIDDVYRKEIVGNSTVEAAFWKWWTGGGGGVLLDGEWNTNGQCFGSPYCAHGENNQ